MLVLNNIVLMNVDIRQVTKEWLWTFKDKPVGSRMRVEVEREKEPTGSLLGLCKVLLKPSQPLVKGFVNPVLILWVGNKRLNKMHSLCVSRSRGNTERSLNGT